MSEKVEVRISFVPLQDGGEVIIQSKGDPLHAWRKWYSLEWEFGSELSALGLTDDEAPVAQGKLLSTRRKLKEEATVDPEELLRYGFRLS